jgi:hypothetical protein
LTASSWPKAVGARHQIGVRCELRGNGAVDGDPEPEVRRDVLTRRRQQCDPVLSAEPVRLLEHLRRTSDIQQGHIVVDEDRDAPRFGDCRPKPNRPLGGVRGP